MAFDSATGQMLLVGGLNNGNYFNDTCEWNGSSWSEVDSNDAIARDFANLTFDLATGQFLLFGGFNGSYLSDTWQWDGSSWSEISESQPGGRYGSSMAYDQATGQVVLFGGYNGGYLNDTWMYASPESITPTTVATAIDADTSSYASGTWTNQAVTVKLSANDIGGPGVASTSYTINGGDTQTYTIPFTLSSEGDHPVTFWSTDSASNAEPVRTVHVMIDLSPPVVTYSGNQHSYTVDQTVNIVCSASDALSGVASTTCQNITGPAASFALGSNSFSANATDNAGNIGTGSVTFSVSVTPDSLCTLTKQLVSNSRTTSQLCAPLNDLQLATLTHNAKLKGAFVNTYILLVNQQRGLSAQQKSTLIHLAQAL